MTDNIVWSTLENAISMGGQRATLRKPSVSLPRPLRGLGHITADKRRIFDSPKLPSATSFIHQSALGSSL